MDSASAKSDLREAIKQRLSRLSAKDRAAESRSLCKRILESLPQEPSTVCAFYPMGDEVDIKPLLEEMRTLGHVIYLPRKEGKHFVFRKMTSVDDLVPDEFNIPAPPENADLLEPSDLSVALIPGRAYDRKGNRMGRGNGGYDVWIRNQRASSMRGQKKTQFWGLCFECQVVPEVPMDAHDETVDAVLTARGMQKTR